MEHTAGARLTKQPWRAAQHLNKWIRSALRSKPAPFKKFAQMLRTHLDGILPWTIIRLSNGTVEGMNNKIKSISHRSFGFRTAENFIAAIYLAVPPRCPHFSVRSPFFLGTPVALRLESCPAHLP